MLKWIAIFIVSAMLVNCRRAVPQLNVQKDKYCTLIDSTLKTNNFIKHRDDARFAYYPIFYIGRALQTYTLSSQPIKGRLSNQHIDHKLVCGQLENNHLTIFVDTALDLAYKEMYTHWVYDLEAKVKEEPKVVTDSVKYFKAYPVFISNTCDSTLYMGVFNYVNFTITEAKNERGQWVPLETTSRGSWCGVKCRYLFIKPKEVMIAKLLHYNGDFKTICRLKLTAGKNIVYSNTFTQRIDKRMLMAF